MKRRRFLAASVLIGLASACTKETTEPYPESEYTLRILGGSELADMKPVFDEVYQKTKVGITLDSVGTLDGVEQIAQGKVDGKYDGIWFSSNRYLTLNSEAARRIGKSAKIMASPVVLGLRRSAVERLGWSGKQVSWSDIASASAAKKFSYGMTDPSASNSGFSALVGVASALADTGAALDTAQIEAVTPKLKDFFASQQLSAGSSGWLSEAFVRRAKEGSPIDGLINYESVLLSLAEPVDVIYPSDGVVTADYPLTLLNSASDEARSAFDRAVSALRDPKIQQLIVERTHRRPVIGGLKLPDRFGTATLNELPFPAQASAADALLAAYFDKIRRPSRTIYVLDTSGSMRGQRLASLKQAMAGLSGADASLTGRYSKFRAREQVTLIPFSSEPGEPRTFTVPTSAPESELARIKAATQALVADGETAIYSSLRRAYEVAGEQIAADPDRFTSIVLMSDGENTSGIDLKAFQQFHKGLSTSVPVFPVLFGESATQDMAQVATMTGGRTFDARTVSLAAAFKEIRGYQ